MGTSRLSQVSPVHSHEVVKADGRPSNSSPSRAKTLIRSASSPHWIIVKSRSILLRIESLYSASLPGVRSDIESMDIRGRVFNNKSEVANKPAQTRLAVKCTLRDMVTGNTGLKSAQIPRNTEIHM
jgi:hypothetical protein